MKRTLQFGLLGVLAVFPYGLGLVLDSWGGRGFIRDVVIRRSDAVMYSYIDRILPVMDGRAEIFIFVFCWALALGLAVWMIYAAWRTHPLAGLERKKRVIQVVARALTVLVVAAALAGIGLDAFFIFPPGGIMLLQSSFGGALGPVFMYLPPMTQLAAYAFALAAMVYAAISSGSFKTFLARSGAGVAVMAIVIASLSITANYLDLGKYLDNIPGVTDVREPRTLVVLAGQPSYFRFGEYYNDCSVSESFCVRIPSSRVNAEAVKAYLKRKDFRTALRGPAFSLMALDSMRRLDPAGAMSIYKDALEVTGDVTQGISLITRLVYSPAMEHYRKILDELADESSFDIGGRAALRIGKAYERFGELDKSRYWHNKGMKTARGLSHKDLVYFSVPNNPEFTTGRISGRIMLDESPAQGLNVGIMRDNICKQLLFSLARGAPRDVLAFTDLQGVMDGVRTDKDGHFSFGGLEADNYVLLLSLADVNDRRYKVLSSPGILQVSRQKADVNTGTIRLSLVAP
jgi:hypothetical protein